MVKTVFKATPTLSKSRLQSCLPTLESLINCSVLIKSTYNKCKIVFVMKNSKGKASVCSTCSYSQSLSDGKMFLDDPHRQGTQSRADPRDNLPI